MAQINVDLNVNGFDISACYFQEDVDGLFLPLIETLSALRKKKDGRLIVYLAAPPGAGKTTLSLFLTRLSEGAIQAVGIDGFHYPQEYIKAHSVNIDGKTVPMQKVKGSPETYDLRRLTDRIGDLKEKDIKWPIYDRNLHDVVQDVVLVDGGIILIEGNWLLLDEDGWRELLTFCDYSIFISADEAMLRGRLVQRKVSGGLTLEQAELFYTQSDSANVVRVLTKRLTCDLELRLSSDGKYSTP